MITYKYKFPLTSACFSYKGQPVKRACVIVKAAHEKSYCKDKVALDGTIPETINGRLAMVGYLKAAATELHTGEHYCGTVLARRT